MPTDPKRRGRKLEPITWRGHHLFKRGDRYVIRLTLPDGRKVQKSAGSPKEAIRLRTELRAAIDRGDCQQPSRMSVQEFSGEWLGAYRGRSRLGVRDSTVSEYDDDLRLHVLPALGRFKLPELRPSHVDKLVKQLADGTAPSPPGFKRRALSPGSVQRAVAPLRAMLSDAQRAGLITSSPCAGLRLPGDRQLTVLEPEQTAALIAAAPEGFDRCLLRLLVETGLRISEALGLRWADLDLEVPELHVRRAVVDGVAGEPKSAYGRRTVPLRRELTAELRRFKLPSRFSGDDDPVFANARGRPADYTNLRRRVLAPAVKAAGLPPIGFHALRHTATTDLLRVGVPLKAVSELLGHHSVEFTLSVYSHVLAGDRPDLDALFGKAAR